MDDEILKQILLEEMQKYSGKGLNDYAYLTSNESDQIYTNTTVTYHPLS